MPTFAPERAVAEQVMREQRTLTVDGAKETWQLVWDGKPATVCGPDEVYMAIACPCSGWAYAEYGNLSLVRSRGGREIERMDLRPLFGKFDYPEMRLNMNSAELRLPHDVLGRASLRGNEYAWPIGDIPKVIEAARQADLASIGGQLQFRLPDGGTCECYWVEVDTYKSVPASLPWRERVNQTAAVALADFSHLSSKFDFVAEGRRSFVEHFNRLEAEGGDPTQTMCFVWYLDDGESLPDPAQS